MSAEKTVAARLCNRATCPGLFGRPDNFTVPRIGKIYLAAVTAETLIMWALSISMLTLHDPENKMGQVYAGLGAFCTAGLMYFAFDAVLSENKFQFIASHITAILYTFFVIWEVFRNPFSLGEAWTHTRYAAMAVKLAFQLFYWGIAMNVWQSFGFFTWKIAGASLTLKHMYNRYRVFLTLIKFDVFVATVLFILASAYLVNPSQPSFYVGMISLVMSLVFLITGWAAVARENRRCLYVFYVLSLLQPIYICLQSWWISERTILFPANVSVPQFAILASFTVVLRVGVVISAFRCSRDFGNGLKEMVFEGRKAQARPKSWAQPAVADIILADGDLATSLNAGPVVEEVTIESSHGWY